MQWYEKENKVSKDSKINKLLIIAISITIIFIVLIIALIIILSNKSTKQIAYVNGNLQKEIYSMMKIQEGEDGKKTIYFPIKDFAISLGYKAFNGEYKSATEDKNKCYVVIIKNEKEAGKETEIEVSNFSLDSNLISKLDLTEANSEYENFQIDSKVIQKDDVLYTTVEGIEKALNISFEIDEEKEQITIYTLEYLSDIYSNAIQQGKYPGCDELDTQS